MDVETTGRNVRRDRVIALAAVELDAGLTPRRSWSARFNPGIPIPAQATQHHGIHNDDVAGELPFSASAARLRSLLVRHTIIGYNVRFDLDILSRELQRCGHRTLPTLTVVDPFLVFCAEQPRTLTAALRYYCNVEHAGAHDPMADVQATLEVLRAQLRRKGLQRADSLVVQETWGRPDV